MFNRGDAVNDKEHYIGTLYTSKLIQKQQMNPDITNYTFEKGSRSNWPKCSIGKVLACTNGRGVFQERGKEAIMLYPGVVVEIPANAEHWYGAQQNNQSVFFLLFQAQKIIMLNGYSQFLIMNTQVINLSIQKAINQTTHCFHSVRKILLNSRSSSLDNHMFPQFPIMFPYA